MTERDRSLVGIEPREWRALQAVAIVARKVQRAHEGRRGAHPDLVRELELALDDLDRIQASRS
jgi:hypothetical protein